MTWLPLDLFRQVKNVLQQGNGGTGHAHGSEWLLVRAINSTGADIERRAIVEYTNATNAGKVQKVASANSTSVLGVCVGYYDGFELIEDDCPDGYEAAVQIGGVAEVLIESTVTRGQYAVSAATDGEIVSTAVGSFAFGRVIDSQDTGAGATFCMVALGLPGAGSGGGSSALGYWDGVITKTADEDVASSTTLQDDNELKFTTVSNGLYEFELFFWMANPGAGSAPDIKFSVGEDNTFRGYAMRLAGNSGTGTSELIAGSVQSNQAFTAQTGTTPFAVWCRGSFVGGGGTFKLQWAQNASNVNPTRVYAGSTLKYKRTA